MWPGFEILVDSDRSKRIRQLRIVCLYLLPHPFAKQCEKVRSELCGFAEDWLGSPQTVYETKSLAEDVSLPSWQYVLPFSVGKEGVKPEQSDYILVLDLL